LILDADTGCITDVNPFLVKLLGRTRRQFLGKQLWEIGLFKDARKSKAAFRELQREGYIRYENLPLETKNGRRIEVEFVSNVYQAAGARVIQCNIRDITMRKHVEMEKAILESSEREQRRIGQELHDGLCQQLTGVALLAKALAKKLSAKMSTESAEVAEITELINQAVDQTRDLARGLSPVEVEAAGLVPALHKFAASTERFFGISCVFTYDEASPFQRPQMLSLSTHLYRIAQEAVNNAIQHGKARRVILGLTTAGDRGILTVRDDGIGVPADAENNKQGLGLRSMRYRAGMIKASLDIRREELSGGTIVTCSFPYRNGREARRA
jgi:PAS domain S-box-containing protein